MISHYIPTIISMIPPYQYCFYHYFYRRGHEGRWRCPNCRNARFSTPLRICPKRAINIEKKNGRHYGQLLEERSMVSDVFFSLLVFSRFLLLWPKKAKTNGITQKKTKHKKINKKNHPMSPVQLLRSSLWVDWFQFFVFVWFSRGFCFLVSPTVSGVQLL